VNIAFLTGDLLIFPKILGFVWGKHQLILNRPHLTLVKDMRCFLEGMIQVTDSMPQNSSGG
jgi:hypothetical protein